MAERERYRSTSFRSSVHSCSVQAPARGFTPPNSGCSNLFLLYKKKTDISYRTCRPSPGGEGEIRTLGSFYTTTVFKTVTINHSVTSPRYEKYCTMFFSIKPYFLICYLLQFLESAYSSLGLWFGKSSRTDEFTSPPARRETLKGCLETLRGGVPKWLKGTVC